MDGDEARYLQDNRRIAVRLMILLGDRRLLSDRIAIEDYEECRVSANELRGVLGAEMLTVSGDGFLLPALREMQRACTIFVSAAGRESEAFERDDALFRYHLVALRDVFAQRVGLIVERFDLQATPEIQAVIDFRE